MPILNRDDAAEVRDSFDQFFEAQPERRPGILRGLFTEILDFERVDGRFELAHTRDRTGIELPAAGDRIASLEGVNVLYVALQDTDRVRKSEVVAVAKQVRDDLGEDMLLLVSNAATSQLHWIYPDFGSGANPTLKRMVVERDLPRRTVIQQISNIYWRYEELGNLLDSIKEAFDVEPVTKEFFKQYKTLFEAAEERITGFADTDQGREDRKQFIQTLFNRLMFVYFLSRKGWLKYKGKTDYLNALWDAYAGHPDHDNFYHDRLTFLFFQGLNNPDSRDVRGGVDFLIGDVPFLNGGLFEESELDELDGVHVPDDAVRPLMTELFDKFNFTVMESTPFDIEVAVDPEMLGKVFEELVTGRHDSGAYYTPRPVVSFMCREALKGYLDSYLTTSLTQGEGEPSDPRYQTESNRANDPIAAFVDRHDASGLSLADARAISEALDNVTVVDPACGSGAYLVGMMQELVELQETLYNQQLRQDPKSLYELKLHIIQRNLHGVDLDPFAVNIAMLRLWLSLAIEFEGAQPEPLPNLDFKIVQGDSLLGPDPSQISLDSHAIRQSNLGALKAQYMRATIQSDKDELTELVKAAEDRLKERLGDANVAEDNLDWRIDFAEVIAEGGFDIAIANPPYIDSETMVRRNPEERAALAAQYSTAKGNWDYYILFWERGFQLLAPDGIGIQITPNKWLAAPYGRALRALLRDHIQSVCDLTKVRVFERSSVDPVIVSARVRELADHVEFYVFDSLSNAKRVPSVPRNVTGGHDNLSLGFSPFAEQLSDWVSNNKLLGELTTVHSSFTVSEAYELAKIMDNSLDYLGQFRFINTGTIDAYEIKWGERPARYLGEKYLHPVIADTSLEEWFPSRHKQAVQEKIIVHGMGKRPEAVFDQQGAYVAGVPCALIREFPNDWSPWFILGVLNSNLIAHFVSEWFSGVSMGKAVTYGKAVLSAIPIAEGSASQRADIASRARECQAAKDANPSVNTSALEAEIDRLVYNLYGLTEEEITAVEGRISPTPAQ